MDTQKLSEAVTKLVGMRKLEVRVEVVREAAGSLRHSAGWTQGLSQETKDRIRALVTEVDEISRLVLTESAQAGWEYGNLEKEDDSS